MSRRWGLAWVVVGTLLIAPLVQAEAPSNEAVLTAPGASPRAIALVPIFVKLVGGVRAAKGVLSALKSAWSVVRSLASRDSGDDVETVTVALSETEGGGYHIRANVEDHDGDGDGDDQIDLDVENETDLRTAVQRIVREEHQYLSHLGR